MGVGRHLRWCVRSDSGSLCRDGGHYPSFNKEEWECLGRVRGADLSTLKVFLEEVFSGFSLFGG